MQSVPAARAIKRSLALLLLVTVSVWIGVKKVLYLAAAPIAPKPCTFIYPESSGQTEAAAHALPEDDRRLLPFRQVSGVINDASCLNQTAVYGIVAVEDENDVRDAVLFARAHGVKITPAGAQHSMGGQSFVKDGLVLDVRGFADITINESAKTVTVQSGARWADIQQVLDARGLAVKAMQSINIFTVGGTLSVNAHGIAHDPGPVASTVKSMRVMLANGEVVTASPTENTELFQHVLGGYGLFGVILEVELEVVDNEMYDWEAVHMDYHDFPEYYRTQVAGNDELGLFFARLSIAPGSYLTETMAHTFTKTSFDQPLPPLKIDDHTAFERFIINFSKTGKMGKWFRWTLERNLVPGFGTCLSRNQAMSQKEVCLISRNQKMYDSMGYLYNDLPDTDILQEYFVPQEKMVEFVDGLRRIVRDSEANLLNVTIRITPKDTVTALPYAKEDMFAFVLYFNQGLTPEDSAVVQKTTIDLIDLTTSLGGTYYLPYQLYYSDDQLRAAYPEIDDVFATKLKYDPDELFENSMYRKYKNTFDQK